VRESYRESDKVKKRSIMNISDWSSEKIAAFYALLKGKQLVARDEILLSGGGTDVVKKLPNKLRPDQSAILNALKLKLPSLVKQVA
jgi:hypothetical protein